MLSTGKSAVTGILNIADYFGQRQRVKEAHIRRRPKIYALKKKNALKSAR